MHRCHHGPDQEAALAADRHESVDAAATGDDLAVKVKNHIRDGDEVFSVDSGSQGDEGQGCGERLTGRKGGHRGY